MAIEIQEQQGEEQQGASLTRDLARGMVALYKEYVGRGPTYARAYVNETLITIVLQDTMLKAERTLAETGEEELVDKVRRVFQSRFAEDAVELVERLSGRKVKSFLSDHDSAEDVAIEAFVLEEDKSE